MSERENWLDQEKQILVRNICEELITKIDPEPFLHIFDDHYNRFGYLGITEQAYQDIAKRVRQAREDIMNMSENDKPKQKILKQK